MNFLSWWDGDGERELLDGTAITNYSPGRDAADRVRGSTSNNGTKSTPGLSADLFGDWREEVVWRPRDNSRAAHLRHARTSRTCASPR